MEPTDRLTGDSRHADSLGPRALTVVALSWGFAYVGWRLTTIGTGWTLALSIPFLTTEIWALSHLALLGIQCWRVPPVSAPPADAFPGTVPQTDVVITAHNSTPEEIERSLVGTAALTGSGRVSVIDAVERPEVREHAEQFHAVYKVDPAVVTSTPAVVHENTASSLYVWLEGGQVAMPGLLLGLIERFDDPQLATCQTAVGLLNPDSLVHLRGGRDEEALTRDVIGPGLDRLGSAPWFGAASMVRRSAVDSIGGFEHDDPAAVDRVLIRLHQSGWKSGFDARRLVRATAADTLDDYLRRRHQRAREGVRVFFTPENPLRAKRLSWRQRLVHLASGLSFGTGIRQLIQLAILSIVLLSGQLPFDASVGTMLAMWAPPTVLAMAARRGLGRGSMALGDWIRHGWRTVGADASALAATLGLKRRASSRSGNAAGIAALGRLRTLTIAVVVLELALVARSMTLFDSDLLPELSTGARIVVLAMALVVLAPMIDVLQVIVFRRQRRRHHRLECNLPITIGGSDSTTLDLAPTGVGLLLESAPQVGAETPFSLTLPALDGTDQTVSGMAAVRAAGLHETGMVRVGLEFINLSDPARLALIAYCAIGHSLEEDSAEPQLTAPSHLHVERLGVQQRSLQALTGAAALAGAALLAVGPAAGTAAAESVGAVELVCVTTTGGEPLTSAAVEHSQATGWEPLGVTGASGCVDAAGLTVDDLFAVVVGDGRIESTPEDLDGSTVTLVVPDHRIQVLDTSGAPVADVAVRYFDDGWHDAASTADGSAHLVSAISSPSAIEVVWQGGRLVQPLSPAPTVVLARLRADQGVDVAEIDRGAGWEPFIDGMDVLPGRFRVRMADLTVAKFEVPGGHQLTVPSGTLGQISVPIPRPQSTPEPTPEAPATPEIDPTPDTPEAPTSEVTETDGPAPTSAPDPEPTATDPDPAPSAGPTGAPEAEPEPSPTTEAES